MVTTHDEFLAKDRTECPHFEEDSEWQIEYWRDLKTTGYEYRICRNCGFHVQRRPLKALIEIMSRFRVGDCNEELGQDSSYLFDGINDALQALDIKHWEAITKDTPQEVGHGENISKDASPT